MRPSLSSILLPLALTLAASAAQAGDLTGSFDYSIPSSDPAHITYATVNGSPSIGVAADAHDDTPSDSGSISVRWEADLTYTPSNASDLPPMSVTVSYVLNSFASAYASCGDPRGSASAEGKVQSLDATTGNFSPTPSGNDTYVTQVPVQETRNYINSVSTWVLISGVYHATVTLDSVPMSASASIRPYQGVARDEDLADANAQESASNMTVG